VSLAARPAHRPVPRHGEAVEAHHADGEGLPRQAAHGHGSSGEDVGKKRTPYMVRRVVSALSSVMADAQMAGQVAQNVVLGLTSRKKKKGKAQQRSNLKLGVDIPWPAEVTAIVGALPANGRRRALILAALFCGLRGSELRGLRWIDVDLDKRELHVNQ